MDNCNQYMRAAIVSIGLLLVAFSIPTTAHASFLIQGSERTVESYSVVKEGTEFIPLIFVCDAYGISYAWDDLTNTIKLYKQGSLLRLLLGEEVIDVNGSLATMPAAPAMLDGTLMVPASILTLPWIQGVEGTGVPLLPTTPTPFVIDRIIIDPGHGGKDPGAINGAGLREKDLVLEIATLLKAELEQRGIRAILTRNRDYFVTLADRARMCNSIEADLFVSIHANAHWNRNANGFEIFYLSEALDDTARAVELMENASAGDAVNCPFPAMQPLDPTLWDIMLTENRRESRTLAQCINRAVRTNGSRNRGVKSARFYVLKWVDKPAVLIELGFITNRREAQKLQRRSYKQQLVQAITRGILDYKRTFERNQGFTK